MKILQINTVVNSGSTGRIAEEIGEAIIYNGWESYIAYGRETGSNSKSNLVKIGNKIDFYFNAISSRLFDNHGFGSSYSTKQFIRSIDKIDFDLIHLHNIHGYYINIELLFRYFKNKKVPVIWTLHDCWAFTGHCVHYTFANCQKWKKLCYSCPQINEYPKSLFKDNSTKNFLKKRTLFNYPSNLTLVPVSDWLENQLKMSFLSQFNLRRIRNGINLDIFTPHDGQIFSEYLNIIKNKKVILGVANVWTERKGLHEFFKLRDLLSSEYVIVLVGLSISQIKNLPEGIVGLAKTKSISDLVWWYNNSDVFFNPTLEDTYPTVNLEAISCGTPVITYNVGGSPESVSETTGHVVERGNLTTVLKSINELETRNKKELKESCRNYALQNFDKRNRYEEYMDLYKAILKFK